MRIPLVAGNWKMNTTVDEALALVNEMISDLKKVKGVDKVICPPFISIYPIKNIVSGTGVELGAQNLYFKDKGAYTGEISPSMISSLCKYVIVGHSERRQYFNETDQIVNEKVKAALNIALIPIMCVGETLEENEANRTREVLERQIRNGFKNITATENIVIAYEPIWAIGTGKAATSEQAEQTISFIRQVISSVWDQKLSETIRILYGGSVNAGNIKELMSRSQIDGALVGGASLKAEEFIEITRQSAAAKVS